MRWPFTMTRTYRRLTYFQRPPAMSSVITDMNADGLESMKQPA